MAIDEYRLQIQQKISEYERLGKFNEDVENDPPSKEIKPEDVDYLGEKFKSKVSTKIANAVAYRYIMKLIRRKKILIKDVVGMEKLQQLNTGFVLTCNHFNPNDNFALHYVLHKYLKKSKKQFYKVIREGNYSNFGGLFGYFFRHCNTLPLSRNIETMKNEWSYDTEGTTSGGSGTHLTGEGYYKFYAPMIKAKMLELLD